VNEGGGLDDRPGGGDGDGSRPGNARRATRSTGEIALGDELLVSLDDDPARDPELAGQGA
jgi:hypothetical protein